MYLLAGFRRRASLRRGAVAALLGAAALACGPPPAPERSPRPEPPTAAAIPRLVGTPVLIDQTAHEPRTAAAATLTPDGAWAATGGADSAVKIWDTERGLIRKTVRAPGPVTKLAFLREGRVLLIGGDDGPTSYLRAVELSTDKVLYHLASKLRLVDGLSLSEDERYLLAESRGEPSFVWDLEKQKVVAHSREDPEPERVSCYRDSTIPRYMRTKERQVVNCGHGARMVLLDRGWQSVEFNGSPSALRGELVLHSRGYDGSPYAELRSQNSGELVFELSGHENVGSVALSADGKTAYTASDARLDHSQTAAVKTWDVATGKLRNDLLVETSKTPPSYLSVGESQVLLGDSRLTIETSHLGNVWDLRRGDVKKSEPFFPPLPRGDHGAARAIAFQPVDNSLIVWEPQSGRRLYELKGHDKFVKSVTTDSRGHTILTTSDDKTARLYRGDDGALQHVFSGHSDEVPGGALSKDGKRAATASMDGTVKIWDLAEGALLRTLSHGEQTYRVAFSRDGRKVLAGGVGAKLWDVESGSLVHDLAPEGRVSELKFADDDALVLGISAGIAQIWSAQSGELLQRFSTPGHSLIGEVSRTERGDTVVYTAGQEVTLHRLNKAYVQTASLTFSQGPLSAPHDRAPWLPPYERLTVTTPEGLFDGEPDVSSQLVYALGDDPLTAALLTGDQLKKHYHRPHLLEAFWKGEPISPPPSQIAIPLEIPHKQQPPRNEAKMAEARGCDAQCQREATAFLGHGAVLRRGGFVGCLWGDDECETTKRYSEALGQGLSAMLYSAAFVTSAARIVAPHLPPALDAPIHRVSAGACVATKAGDIWCEDPGGRFPPYSTCSFGDIVPAPELGVRYGWCQVRQGEPRPVSQLSGSLKGGCAVRSDGALTCWGVNKTDFSQSVAAPVVLDGRRAKQVAVSTSHACVLTDTGEVGCWGDATRGQLGVVGRDTSGDPPEDGYWEQSYSIDSPEKFLAFDAPATRIFAEDRATCALLVGGALWCWGITPLLPDAEYGPDRYQSEIVNSELSSTLPSAPVELPQGCQLKDFDLEQACVICAPSGVFCLESEGEAGAARRVAGKWTRAQ